MSTPNINVTPLIDVLLVLLIIFMVITPMKPSGFKAKIPAELIDPKQGQPNPDTLAVIVDRSGSIRINLEPELATVDDTAPLVEKLRGIFVERSVNGSVSQQFADDPDRPFPDQIERTVFIKAPKSANYGSVIRVIDAVKLAGAYPISLQIDGLEAQ